MKDLAGKLSQKRDYNLSLALSVRGFRRRRVHTPANSPRLASLISLPCYDSMVSVLYNLNCTGSVSRRSHLPPPPSVLYCGMQGGPVVRHFTAVALQPGGRRVWRRPEHGGGPNVIEPLKMKSRTVSLRFVQHASTS